MLIIPRILDHELHNDEQIIVTATYETLPIDKPTDNPYKTKITALVINIHKTTLPLNYLQYIHQTKKLD